MSDNDETSPDNVVRVAFGAPREAEIPADPTAAEKLEIFTRLIDAGMVLVNLDARQPGVRVPPMYEGDAQLGLNFSHRFGLDDFAYDERGVRATLSFQGAGHFCDVPWGAVFMVRSYVTGEVVLFPASLPPEIAPLLEGIEPHLNAARPGDEDDTQRLLPRMVTPQQTDEAAGPDDDGAEGSGDDEPPDDDGPRRPPGLRLVKS